MSFNLREEPVIFVGLNHDFVPYSPRDPSSLKGNIANHGVKPEELADTELKIREEVHALFYSRMYPWKFAAKKPIYIFWFVLNLIS